MASPLEALSAAYEAEFNRWSWYRDKVNGLYTLIRLTDLGLTQDGLDYEREHTEFGKLAELEAIENLCGRMRSDAAARAGLKALAAAELPPRESMNADVFRQFCKNLAESA